MPHNYGYFSLWSTRRVNLDSIVVTIGSTYNGGLTSVTLHDLFTLQILPGINIGVQYIKYTSEYLLKLQIHEHLLIHKFLIWRRFRHRQNCSNGVKYFFIYFYIRRNIWFISSGVLSKLILKVSSRRRSFRVSFL